MALFVDLVALSNGLHGSVQMDLVALFSWIGWLRHRGILSVKVGGVKIETVFKHLLPYFFAIIVVLMLVTYIPQLSLWLPGLMGYVS